MTGLTSILAWALALWVAWIINQLEFAPDGWEDSTGFHRELPALDPLSRQSTATDPTDWISLRRAPSAYVQSLAIEELPSRRLEQSHKRPTLRGKTLPHE